MEEITNPGIQKDQVEKFQQTVEELKKKYAGVALFKITPRHHGPYVIRPQFLSDVRDVNKELTEFLDKRLQEYGGTSAIEKLPEDEQYEIQREINNEYADKSNEIVLRQCVVYPEAFAENLKSGQVPAGLGPLLLDKIMEISGWSDVDVEEV